MLDSGFLKILLELGMLGWFQVVLMSILTFLVAVNKRLYFLAVSLAVLYFLVAKMHLVLSDPIFVGYFIYLSGCFSFMFSRSKQLL